MDKLLQMEKRLEALKKLYNQLPDEEIIRKDAILMECAQLSKQIQEQKNQRLHNNWQE